MGRLAGECHRHAEKLITSRDEHRDAIARLVVVETARELIRAHTPLLDRQDLVVRHERVRGRGAFTPDSRDDEPAGVVAGGHAQRRPAAACGGAESQAVGVERVAVFQLACPADPRAPEISERCAGDLLRYFERRVHVAADAADLLNEAMLIAWRRSDDCPTDAQRQRMWLFTIAANVLSNHCRSSARRHRLADRLRTSFTAETEPGHSEANAVRDAVLRPNRVSATTSPSKRTPGGALTPATRRSEGARSNAAKTEVSLWKPVLSGGMMPGPQTISGERMPPS